MRSVGGCGEHLRRDFHDVLGPVRMTQETGRMTQESGRRTQDSDGRSEVPL